MARLYEFLLVVSTPIPNYRNFFMDTENIYIHAGLAHWEMCPRFGDIMFKRHTYIKYFQKKCELGCIHVIHIYIHFCHTFCDELY